SNQIINSIFATEDPLPKEQLSRLLNALASECAGREYILMVGSQATATLYSALKNEEGDSLVFQNLIGAVQKLSLRRNAQTYLNNLSVIDLLLTILERYDTYSDYTVEYAIALLMNLCLRTAGRKQCLQDPERVLNILADLMQTDNPQILTYVNGTLYSLLAEPELRECAREMRFGELLEEKKRAGGTDGVDGQIEFVLDQLGSEEEPTNDTFSDDGQEEDHEDEDNEDEDTQEEDEDEDLPPLTPTEPTKEALLLSRYCRTPTRKPPVGGMAGSHHLRDSPVRQSMPASTLRRNMVDETEMRRPKTPNSRPLTPSRSPLRGGGGVYASTSGGSVRGGLREVKKERGEKGGRREVEDEDSGPRPISIKTAGKSKVVPVTEADFKEFHVGFSSKPKIPRTPEY
ncbi:LisH domain-containing protein armc9, partial [Dinochytrium kinnereticum]